MTEIRLSVIGATIEQWDIINSIAKDNKVNLPLEEFIKQIGYVQIYSGLANQEELEFSKLLWQIKTSKQPSL